MQINEYLAAITASEPRDWAHFESPTYLGEDCTDRFAYLPDLSIGLAWGSTLNPDFGGGETWVQNFPDHKASSHDLDFLYNGMLVHREAGVYVDGFRCVLPIPRVEKQADDTYSFWVYEADLVIWRLFNAILNSTTDFDQFVRQSGFDLR